VTTPPATSGPSAPGRSIVNSPQPYRQKKRRIGQVLLMIWAILVATLLILIIYLWLVNGEWVCLDRHPVWGPPENPEIYTSCSGHIDELLRKWRWVS
jgi:hypothetical protein